MAGSDDNYPGVIGHEIPPGGLRGVGKYPTAITGPNRRALSNINRNISGDPPYPRAVKKRGLSERNVAICDQKNPPIRAHRSITRKFAAQMANTQQPKSEESKNSLPPEDSTIIDMEDYKAAGDLPIFVEHTEAMLEEIYRTEKVEMEDVVEEPMMDIDSCNKKNPLAAVEYIEDLYDFYKNAEASGCVSPSYMFHQFDINERMRGILIDWLIEVHYKFELMEETLYLTINLIDRFLAFEPVVRKKLQLVGVTAMLLACKYEEVTVPVVEDLIVISDKAYTRKELLEMEKLMINTLQFNLSVPTPYVFMRRFLKTAQADKQLELLSFFMIELCLVEYEMLKFPPSLLSAAAIYTAQCTLSGSRQWSKTSEWHNEYSEVQLLECSRMMATFHQNAATGKLTGVHRKYSTSKFGYAAKTQPANFLLEDPQDQV